MIPLRIEGADYVKKAPPGYEKEVRDLHVKVIDGCSVSRWELTPEELRVLVEGGSVELWVMGAQPAVFITAQPHADSPLPAPPGGGDADQG